MDTSKYFFSAILDFQFDVDVNDYCVLYFFNTIELFNKNNRVFYLVLNFLLWIYTCLKSVFCTCLRKFLSQTSSIKPYAWVLLWSINCRNFRVFHVSKLNREFVTAIHNASYGDYGYHRTICSNQCLESNLNLFNIEKVRCLYIYMYWLHFASFVQLF